MKTTESKEDIQAKADLLADELKCKVIPLMFMTQDKEPVQIIGFIKNPDFYVKSAAFDQLVMSSSAAGKIILDNCLIREHSDPRIMTDEEIMFSAVLACVPIIGGLKNEMAKKKN